MPETPAGWNDLVESLADWMPPSWSRNARDHGSQPWIRLILLVDAHAALCNPQATEKIAMTMSDLAEGREGERAGWTAIAEHARNERMEVVASLVDRSEAMLPADLLPFFSRSVEPLSHFNAQ